MKKSTARVSKPSRKVTKVVSRKPARKSVAAKRSAQPNLFMGGKSLWGNDQTMILLLSAGIIVLVVVGMYLSGWL